MIWIVHVGYYFPVVSAIVDITITTLFWAFKTSLTVMIDLRDFELVPASEELYEQRELGLQILVLISISYKIQISFSSHITLNQVLPWSLLVFL